MSKYQSLFNRGGLSLDRLRNFVLIADADSLSRAADRDPARMSLFSKQIKELESFFGVSLTRREGRTIKLTEAGQHLARLARVNLGGLEDFQQTCQQVPQTIALAAGNSLLEWLVVPQLGVLRQALPNIRVALHTGRTRDLLDRLTDMSVDLALIRADAVVRPLKCRRIGQLSYSLFLPRRLAAKVTPENLKEALADIPLATSMGGQFRENLTTGAERAGYPLRIDLSCASFTQAVGAVKTGDYGGVLPNLARPEFKSGEVVEMPLPFMKGYARPIALAWNPRLVEVRPPVALAIRALFPAGEKSEPLSSTAN